MSDTQACKCEYEIDKDVIEKILKAYRTMRWRIEADNSKISIELRKRGISTDVIAFLKQVFFQETDLTKLATMQVDLAVMSRIAKIVDFSLESLKQFPDNGILLHKLIAILYTEDCGGLKLKFEDAYEKYREWAETDYDKTISMATFKKYRTKAIELMTMIMGGYIKRLINNVKLKTDEEPYKTISEFTFSA